MAYAFKPGDLVSFDDMGGIVAVPEEPMTLQQADTLKALRANYTQINSQIAGNLTNANIGGSPLVALSQLQPPLPSQNPAAAALTFPPQQFNGTSGLCFVGTATPTPPMPTAPPNPLDLPNLPAGVKVIKTGPLKKLVDSGELVIGDHVVIAFHGDKLRDNVLCVFGAHEVRGDGQEKFFFFHTDQRFCGEFANYSVASDHWTKLPYGWEIQTKDRVVWILGGKGMKKKKAVKKKNVKLDFTGMVLSQEIRESITSVLTTHCEHNREKLYKTWGLGKTIEKGKGMAMLFHGVPGTGKTKCAAIIAKEFGLKLKIIDPGMIWSSEPGEAERVLAAAFKEADEKKDQLLLFDECETLVANRNGSGQILAAQTNALLMALENYEGISIFTTNRTPQLDPAFNRRLQLKVEFPAPDYQTRLMIWKTLIPKKMPLGACVKLESLAKSSLTGGYIKNVILNAARRAIVAKTRKVLMEHFEKSLTDELNGMAAFAECDETPRLMGPGVRAGMGADTKMAIENKAHMETAKERERRSNAP